MNSTRISFSSLSFDIKKSVDLQGFEAHFGGVVVLEEYIHMQPNGFYPNLTKVAVSCNKKGKWVLSLDSLIKIKLNSKPSLASKLVSMDGYLSAVIFILSVELNDKKASYLAEYLLKCNGVHVKLNAKES